MRDKILVVAVCSMLSLSMVVTAGVAAPRLTLLNVSYQPANWWAVPFYLAIKHDWWAQVGLKVNYSIFPAGMPQIAASAAHSWDVGSTGSVPAVVGAARYGLLTIGVSNDESTTNVLIATKEAAVKFEKDPASIKGHRILLTANSTGEYAVGACLKKYGMTEHDVRIINLGEAGIVSALTSGTASYGGVWAPNSYTLEEKVGAKIICSGRDANAVIPGALVARADFARDHPELVARYLAVYEHSVQWELKHPQETMVALIAADNQAGITLLPKYAKVEMQRPIFPLAEQLKIMARRNGKRSEADVWMTDIAEFMKSKGTLQQTPNAAYITDKYMKMVEANPELRTFANNGSR